MRKVRGDRLTTWAATCALLCAAGCTFVPEPFPSDPDASVPDARPLPIDANYCDEGCNPLAQTGCQAGEKCALFHPESEADEFDICDVRCFADGSLPEGAECQVEPGQIDDCVAGTLCYWGHCQQLCTPTTHGGCEQGACGARLPGLEWALMDVCYPPCDPLDPVDCGDGFGCYFHTDTYEHDPPACLPAGTAEAGQPCGWSEACAPELVCVGTAMAPFATDPDHPGHCAPVCDPTDDTCTAGQTCVRFQTTTFGACVPNGS